MTPKAIDNLNRNAKIRGEEPRLRLEPVEKTLLIFDPEKIEAVEEWFNDKGKMLFLYTVIDPITSRREIFPAGVHISEIIDSHLKRGRNILGIKRIGTDEKAKHIVTPVPP